ncbi:DUF4192 domain-containing protein [Nocardioides gilvus]|uniref:DUF4192 domain-containing protein n=1 Tax=Nocardioides gilvus TaxID=1735589 RepID=UPI000D745CE9|nr:DUF4192 domain-containing protein [Nocardioides gilvus]
MTSHTALTVRTPSDLLACVPLLLGFVPEESAVVISLPPGTGPHVRVDLGEPEDLTRLACSLVEPTLRHGVRRIALVVFSSLERAPGPARFLARSFAEAGIEVAALVAADGSRSISLTPGHENDVPTPYDSLSHPFVAEAVLRGQVVLGSREELREQLSPDVDAVARVAALVDDEVGDGTGPVAVRRSARWVTRCLAAHARAGSLPSDEEVASLVLSLERTPCRDAAWAWVKRVDARAHVEIWLRIVRSTPVEYATAPAAVLAFHAWLAGDGALAWCAVEHSVASGQSCSLTDLVEDLLERAAPPHLWTPLMEDAVDEDSWGDVVPMPRQPGPRVG